MDEVYMDIPAVRGVAKTLHTVSETLKAVLKALDMLVNVLKATAFIGLVGGAAVIQFIEATKPMIEKVAETCEELSSDVNFSVDAFERGDQQGATRFY